MTEVEWTQGLVLRLIQEYQTRRELWDSSHESYRVQTLKYETWRELAAMFQCEIADLRKKLNSLFASHRREKAKVRQGGRSFWFLYPHLSFLPTHVDDTNVGIEEVVSTQNVTGVEIEEKEASTDEEYNDNGEVEEELIETVQEEVLIKEEPIVKRYSRPRVRNQPIHKPRISRVLKRRVPKQNTNNIEDKLSEALKVIKQSDQVRRKDECDSFGEYIADSLRKHDERTQSMIKQAINNILFEQEMKKYSASNQYTVVISGIDENPLILDGTEKYKG